MFTIRIPKADRLARVSFIIFMFTTFFGTTLPFQPTMQELGAEEIGAGNIINQIIYPFLFFLSFLAFISKPDLAISLVRKEKMLTLFLIYALLTVLWSDFPIISFKRWFQIFTYFFVTLIYLSSIKSINELMNVVRPILYTYIIITILSIILIPGAKDPTFGSWRGLTSHKNNLGQKALFCVIISTILYFREYIAAKKYVALLMILISVLLVIGSLSSTSYTALFLFILISLLFFLKNQLFSSIGVGYFIFFSALFSIIVVFLILFLYTPEFLDILQGAIGKEGGLEDRNRLWQVILLNISEHLVFGCGFQGFWVPESPTLGLLYTSFIWLPMQAHNGYLDMLNEIGVIGLTLFILVIIFYLRQIIINKNITLWAWFIIIPLIINFTETTIVRIGSMATIMFFVAYLEIFIRKQN